ncbi:hypothetical protein GQ457_12G017210 [Hibiscus cannabinus]
MERKMMDVASGGAILNKTPTQALDLINVMAANSQQLGPHQDIVSRYVNEISAMGATYLNHFREARGVFSEIQSDRSEENVKNLWSVSLHVEKDINRRRQTVVGATVSQSPRNGKDEEGLVFLYGCYSRGT